MSSPTPSLFVDVGAKFGSNFPILKAATNIYGFPLKTCIDDLQYRVDYIIQNVMNVFDGDQYNLQYSELLADILNSDSDLTLIEKKDFKNMPTIFRDSMINNI